MGGEGQVRDLFHPCRTRCEHRTRPDQTRRQDDARRRRTTQDEGQRSWRESKEAVIASTIGREIEEKEDGKIESTTHQATTTRHNRAETQHDGLGPTASTHQQCTTPQTLPLSVSLAPSLPHTHTHHHPPPQIPLFPPLQQSESLSARTGQPLVTHLHTIRGAWWSSPRGESYELRAASSELRIAPIRPGGPATATDLPTSSPPVHPIHHRYLYQQHQRQHNNNRQNDNRHLMAETVDVAIRVLATISRLLFVLTWPFVKLARGVALLLSPVWTVAQFILLPLTVVVQAVLSILLFPFRLNWLDRFETIYIYLGIATLIGFLAGAVLYLSFNFLTSTLRIDSSRSISALESKTRRKPRTTVEYRADRDKRKGIVPVPSTTLRGDMASQRQRGLLAQTIIEEEDSDF